LTKNELEERLKVIEQHIAQTNANLNMLLGGKEEILYWLAQLQKNEAEK